MVSRFLLLNSTLTFCLRIPIRLANSLLLIPILTPVGYKPVVGVCTVPFFTPVVDGCPARWASRCWPFLITVYRTMFSKFNRVLMPPVNSGKYCNPAGCKKQLVDSPGGRTGSGPHLVRRPAAGHGGKVENRPFSFADSANL